MTGCGGGGGGGSSAPPIQPPPPPTGPATEVHAGLLALASSSGQVRVDWDLPEAGYEAALFHSASRATLLIGAPALTGLAGSNAIVSGLANGQNRFFAMAIRPNGTTTWTQAGPALHARPGAPIFVDAAAATGGDGNSAATAFNSLASGLAAAATTAGNVWVRDGNYPPAALQIPPGVHVFGGFPAGTAFTLANRTPLQSLTVLTAGSLQAVLEVATVGDRSVLDGLVLDGRGVALYGLDQSRADIEARSLTVRDCADRGIRLRNTSITEPSNVLLVNCNIQQNRGDGVSASGPYALVIDACRFDSNVQEGLDLANLIALNGGVSSLTVTDSRFFGNGLEGLDASLAQPLGATAGTGRFDVTIRGSRFEGNALDGLLIDQEHELAPGWHAHVVVRECTALDNGGAGVHVDADASGEYLLQRICASANRTDGIWISSETHAGHVVVSASQLSANLQAGIRASLGNKIVLASHCMFAGNLGGGFVSSVRESGANSCIAHLQQNPYSGVRVFASSTVTDNTAAVFSNSPNAYAQVNTHATGTLGLAAPATFTAGSTVEVADSGTSHTAAQVSGTTVVLNDTPSILRLPTVLSAFPGTSVIDNLQLAAGSVVAGQGMAAAGAGNVDPGPFGSPRGGTPGRADSVDASLCWLEQVTPAAALGPTLNQAVVLRLSHAISNGTVTPDRVRVVNGAGNALAAGVSVSGSQITIAAPVGGWGTAPLRIELHRAVAATDGTPFAHPTIVPFTAHP